MDVKNKFSYLKFKNKLELKITKITKFNIKKININLSKLKYSMLGAKRIDIKSAFAIGKIL